MRKHLIITGLCILITAIIIVVGILFADIFNTPTDSPDTMENSENTNGTENQQQSIVANDIMNIAVEMETLLAMCKRDGLLAEEGFSFSTGEEKITLVL